MYQAMPVQGQPYSIPYGYQTTPMPPAQGQLPTYQPLAGPYAPQYGAPRKFGVREEAKDPIHTVFFYNLGYNQPLAEFEQFASQFGPISNIHPIIEKKGQAFVTYFDIRDANRAVAESKTKKLGGREVGTNYAFKSPEQSRRDPYTNCDTVLVKSTSTISVTDVTATLSKFGEVSSAVQASSPNQFLVTFFDTRCTKSAVAASNTEKVGDSPLTIEYHIDTTVNVPPRRAENQYAQPPMYQQQRYAYPPPQYQIPSQPMMGVPAPYPPQQTFYQPADPRAQQTMAPPMAPAPTQAPPKESKPQMGILEALSRLHKSLEKEKALK